LLFPLALLALLLGYYWLSLIESKGRNFTNKKTKKMSTSSVESLITGAVTDIGASALVVLTAVIGLGIAYFIFRFGWKKAKGALR